MCGVVAAPCTTTQTKAEQKNVEHMEQIKKEKSSMDEASRVGEQKHYN